MFSAVEEFLMIKPLENSAAATLGLKSDASWRTELVNLKQKLGQANADKERLETELVVALRRVGV